MKRRILKIRPFNMANFSGGSGYMGFTFYIELFLMVPFHLLALLALLKKERLDTTNEQQAALVEAQLRKSLWGFSLALGLLGSLVCVGQLYGPLAVYWPLVLWSGMAPSFGVYGAIFAAHRLARRQMPQYRLLMVILSLLLLAVAGVLAVYGFFGLDSFLGTLS